MDHDTAWKRVLIQSQCFNIQFVFVVSWKLKFYHWFSPVYTHTRFIHNWSCDHLLTWIFYGTAVSLETTRCLILDVIYRQQPVNVAYMFLHCILIYSRGTDRDARFVFCFVAWVNKSLSGCRCSFLVEQKTTLPPCEPLPYQEGVHRWGFELRAKSLSLSFSI